MHGIQLLTRAQLSRVSSLEGFGVEEVAPDRFLVVADDLEAWYADPGPDPDVLHAARQAFADLILRTGTTRP